MISGTLPPFIYEGAKVRVASRKAWVIGLVVEIVDHPESPLPEYVAAHVEHETFMSDPNVSRSARLYLAKCKLDDYASRNGGSIKVQVVYDPKEHAKEARRPASGFEGRWYRPEELEPPP